LRDHEQVHERSSPLTNEGQQLVRAAGSAAMTTMRLALSGARLAATTAAAAAQVAVDGLVSPRAERRPAGSPNGRSAPPQARTTPGPRPAAPQARTNAGEPPARPAAETATPARTAPPKTEKAAPAKPAKAPAPKAEEATPAKPAETSAPKAETSAEAAPPTAQNPTPAEAAPQPAAWVEPVDGACPSTHPVKANVDSGIFHVVGGLSYERVNADRCYVTPAAAEADGLRAAKR
jgi:hypothetical protein